MRTCGDCKECCTVVAVPELKKYRYVQCEHVCETGCSIYKKRPRPCVDYKCHWLANEDLAEELRPDRCGIIVGDVMVNRTMPGLIFFEARPGALKNTPKMLAEATHHMSAMGPIFLVGREAFEIVTHQRFKSEALHFAAEHKETVTAVKVYGDRPLPGLPGRAA